MVMKLGLKRFCPGEPNERRTGVPAAATISTGELLVPVGPNDWSAQERRSQGDIQL